MPESSLAGGAPSRPAAERLTPDWAAIGADARFCELQRRKGRFLGLLLTASIVFYLLLPVGAAWLPEVFAVRVYGVVNIGILFALSQFGVAWVIAAIYTHRANREFDHLIAEMRAEIMKGHLSGRRQ